MNKNVCVVTVTYGNRFNLLKQVIEASLNEGVDKIIVVDNNSVEESKIKLNQLESKLKNKLKVIYLSKNRGSAGGYKIGLQEAYNCEDCEFIWLLDDDNKSQHNSLKVLKEIWDNLEGKNKEENISLLSYRKDRTAYKEAIKTNNPDLVLGRKNGFLGFHILNLPKKITNRVKNKLNTQTFRDVENLKSGIVSVAPYGGMFFHKKLLDKIGYPDEKFFVYGDDYDFSYRITLLGGRIILCMDSLIIDLEKSFHLDDKKSFTNRILNANNSFQSYYMTLNNIRFESNFVTNKMVYLFNAFIYIMLSSLICLFSFNRKTYENYKAFIKAIYDSII